MVSPHTTTVKTPNHQSQGKSLKSSRQPKPPRPEQSKTRNARSSEQKSKPSLAAASKKGMTIRKQKNNFSHISSKSATLHHKLKSHSIEPKDSFDLDNKENLQSNSSLH